MGRPRPRATPAHRGVRPRYGRIFSAVSSVFVTTVAVLAALDVLPGAGAAAQDAVPPAAAGTRSQGAMQLTDYTEPTKVPREARPAVAESDTLPPGSGTGRRVVFDMSAQRVWLVEGARRVQRTYLVSGSLTDNLRPGTYEVYSTSRHAVGIDDSGTMEYMVRFAHGERAAIGFHDIPVDDGQLVQTRAELGTPRSHGCIRQWRPDARALWHFAPVGTRVVVTA